MATTKEEMPALPEPYKDCGVHDSFSDGNLPIHLNKPAPLPPGADPEPPSAN